MSVAVGSGQWQQTSRPSDYAYPTQAPKGRISGLPTTSSGKPFQLWAQGLFCTERSLARRLKNNSFYPFTQQQPNGARGPKSGTGTRTLKLGLERGGGGTRGGDWNLNRAGRGGARAPGPACCGRIRRWNRRLDPDREPGPYVGLAVPGPSPGAATSGSEQEPGVLTRLRRAAPSLRARVLPGHAVEGDAALHSLHLAHQLRPRERGLSSRARPHDLPTPGARPHPAPGPAAAQGVPAAPAGAEAGDLGLPCVRRGSGPVADDLVAAAAPPGAEPRARRVPLLHPGPHRVSGPHAPGLRAPGAQLRR